jgi:hypothetical protein
MLTKTQYILLIEEYMIKYDISVDEARKLIMKHKMDRYVKALQEHIIENHNLSSL